MRRAAADPVYPRIPGRHHLLHVEVRGKGRILFNHGPHPVNGQPGQSADLFRILDHEPVHRLEVVTRRGMAGDIHEALQQLPFHRAFPVGPDGPSRPKGMLHGLGTGKEIRLDRFALLRSHIPVGEGPCRAYGHAVPARDAIGLGVADRLRHPVPALIQSNEPSRAFRCAEPVSRAFFRIHLDQRHRSLLLVLIARTSVFVFLVVVVVIVVEIVVNQHSQRGRSSLTFSSFRFRFRFKT